MATRAQAGGTSQDRTDARTRGPATGGATAAPASPPAPAGGARTGASLAPLLQATAQAVAAVQGGRSLTEVLAAVPPGLRPGTQALSFQVLRHLGAAQVLRQQLAPRRPPPAVEPLLLVALALLWPAADGSPPPYAPHTLVDQAVAAVRQRVPAAAGFVNAVLRRFLREQAACVRQALADPLAQHQHPAWWAARLARDWPQQAPALMAQAGIHPPMVLRVNARRSRVDAYLARLAEAGLAAQALPLGPGRAASAGALGAGAGRGGDGDADRAPVALPAGASGDEADADTAIWLREPCPVERLPGFADGLVSVQDASAQRAAALLLGPAAGLPPLPPGARVLDACAAPGGKTAHLLERAELDLLALDQDPQRLERVRQTLQRLGLQAQLACADAADPARWWDGRPFDAILLDAPCSASGIVRRHPDIRWLRRPEDIDALAATQARLLDALWPLLKPGGRLLYATCSVFRAEGVQQIDAFLQRTTRMQPRLSTASPGHILGLPDNPAGPETGHPPPAAGPVPDGFFYALLTASG